MVERSDKMNRVRKFERTIAEAYDYIRYVDNLDLEIKTIYNLFYFAKKEFGEDPVSETYLFPKLMACRDIIPPRYIIQYKPNFQNDNDLLGRKARCIQRKNFDSDEEYLDMIVLIARKKIFDDIYDLEKFNNMDGFKAIDVSDRCYTYSRFCNQLLKNNKWYGLSSAIKEITAGFDRRNVADNALLRHYYIDLSLNDKKYIIDLTYSQFFLSSENILEYLGMTYADLPLPGIYMLQDEKRLKVARTLLERGWIEATDENIKSYFDGFALSFRNGYFYEQLGNSNFITPYTAKDYESFIVGYNSQLSIEGKSCIGYQILPLDNILFDFTSDKVLYESAERKLVKF